LVLIRVSIRYYKKGWFYIFGLILFGLYLIAVIDIIFFPIPIPENWPDNLNLNDTIRNLKSTNLILFNYRSNYSTRPVNIFLVLRDIIANILLTVPVGFGICFLTRVRFKQILYLALITGLVLEGTQLVIKLISGVYYHAVDVNDVLWNASGVLVGFLLYHSVRWVIKSVKKYKPGK
jgi:glycopeptide antibiotics resistance protein